MANEMDGYCLIRSQIVSDGYPRDSDHTVDVELVSEQKFACTAKIMLGKHSLHTNYHVERPVRPQF